MSTGPELVDGSRADPHSDGPAVTQARVGRSVEVGISILGVVAAPALLFLVYGMQRFYQLSGADPFIYTGYAASPSDLIARFGYTYYSVRFGLIIPSNIALETLGTVGGYFTLRWILSSLAAGAFYFVIRHLYRWELGILGAVLLLLNPIFVHAVMTMYSTTVGVPAIAAAAALLLVQGRRSAEIASRVAAGVLLGTTVNTNLFTVLPVSALLAAWFTARVICARRAAIYELTCVAVAAIAVSVVGALVYWLQFGDPNLLRPSLESARQLSAAEGAGAELDLRWLGYRPEIWLPLLASGALGLTLVLYDPRPRWHELAGAGMPALMWLSYGVHELVFDDSTFETYFYTSYMWGPTVLAAAMAIGRVAQHHRHPSTVIGVSIVAVLVFPVVWTHGMRTMSVWSLNGVVPLAVSTGVALVAARRWSRVGLLASLLLAIIPLIVALGTPRNVPLADGQSIRQDPYYEEALFQDDRSILDLYVIATDFALSIPREETTPGSVVFWYDDTDYVVTLVQWTYLWVYSKLQSSVSPGLPSVDLAERSLLEDRTPRFVIVMASDESTVDAAETTLDGLDLERVKRSRAVFERGRFRIVVGTSEYVPSMCDSVGRGEPVSWQTLPPCNTG